MGLFSTVGSIIGGGALKKGLNKASAAQQASSTNQIQRLDSVLGNATAGYTPYTSLGQSAATAFGDLLGIGGQGSTAFNSQQYLAANPDVAAGYETVDKTLFPTVDSYAQWHFSNYGMGEGRAPNSDVGVGAEAAQASAISALEKSPLFSSLVRNGEEAILANASATGGLRGGNIQGGLADFRSDTLAKVIQQQLAGYQGAMSQGLGAQGALTDTSLRTAIGSNGAQQTATDALIQKIMGKAGINAKNWGNVGTFLDDSISKAVGAFGGGSGGLSGGASFGGGADFSAVPVSFSRLPF